jgi:lipopolysaccharide transport system ATP-binding protein
MSVIQTEKLGKMYRLDKASRPDNLREVLGMALHKVRYPVRRAQRREIWAIKEVNLQIEKGEILGIIGKNGAGKSTLLKVLSRVTEPTEGQALIHGRIASLLEIGIGFHPDLTGRENVFLNAALLGMKQASVKSRFNEIVEFAGIADFIDTQVKKYSSGMFVRLAFSIAAHLDSEIVFIDEVLAVGDTDFQKKCIAKVQSIADGGRTVLFVSHNLAAIERLCGRCVVFDHGRIAFDGKTGAALDFYRTNILEKTNHSGNLETDCEKRPGDGRARFCSLTITNDDHNDPGASIITGKPVNFAIGIRVAARIEEPRVTIVIKDQSGQIITRIHSQNSRFTIPAMEKDFEIQCRLAELSLTARTYQVDLWLSERGQTIDYVESAAQLTLNPRTERQEDFYYKGLIELNSTWQAEPSR